MIIRKRSPAHVMITRIVVRALATWNAGSVSVGSVGFEPTLSGT